MNVRVMLHHEINIPHGAFSHADFARLCDGEELFPYNYLVRDEFLDFSEAEIAGQNVTALTGKPQNDSNINGL